MKQVPCEHWSPTTTPGVGRCEEGKFGGLPSYGRCDLCLGGKPRPAPPSEFVALTSSAGKSLAKAEGPKRWAELHRRASEWNPATADAEAELAFIGGLADGLGLCHCRRDWRELLKVSPPDLSTRAAYEAWAVVAHNAVNLRVGKPTYSPTRDWQARPSSDA